MGPYRAQGDFVLYPQEGSELVTGTSECRSPRPSWARGPRAEGFPGAAGGLPVLQADLTLLLHELHRLGFLTRTPPATPHCAQGTPASCGFLNCTELFLTLGMPSPWLILGWHLLSPRSQPPLTAPAKGAAITCFTSFLALSRLEASY